ncbi:MAG: SipW-dependent-type signal peptide-containing protein, partial [Clostridia bacterium]|nr:SipW-dependent-type signal peptide-containing protein [Clostridia bacterium]
MLIGTTFAWFTDTATTSVNKIQSGTLDIALEMKDNEGKWVSAEGKTLQFLVNGKIPAQKDDGTYETILWEPGCTYQLPQLRVVNKGNLAVKFKVAVTGLEGNTELAPVIEWTINGLKLGDDLHLAPKANGTEVFPATEFTISAHMQETAGNEYQNKSIENIAITVVATQDTVEFDSKDNQYDADAIYPVVAAATVNTGSDTVLKDKEVDHNVKLTAPAGSVAAVTTSLKLTVDTVSTPAGISVSDTQNSQTFEVKLVDQNGEKVKATSGLFTVEMNVGTGRTGLKLYHDGVLMTKDDGSLTDAADHYVYNATTGYVTMKVSHFSPFTAVFNKEKWENHAAESYATPVDETNKVVTIASAEELALFAKQVNAGTPYKGYTVKLAANIDLEENQWTPIGKSGSTFQGVFDGQGYTISNLIVGSTGQSDVGLFGITTNGEVKNFTLNNAIVKGYLDVGAVAGTPYTSKYSNITLTGDVRVDGFAYVGGMFGKNAYANLTDLTIDVEDGSYVNAKSGNYRTYVGGLVGFMGEGNQVVKNVTSNIDVTGSTCDVGGITGIAHYGNSFINCKSSGNVTLTSAQDEGDELEIGGIAGVWLNQAGQTVTLTGCSYTGTLSSYNVKTGFVTEFCYNGLVGNKYTRNSDAGTLTIN